MERCSFHLVPHFEEYSPGVMQTVSSIFGNFMFHFLFQLFDCFIIKHSVKFLSVFGGHLVSWNTPPRKEGSYA
jgi:hypothetical protein